MQLRPDAADSSLSSTEPARTRSFAVAQTAFLFLLVFASSCSVDPGLGGDREDSGNGQNVPPVARLAYEIELNQWISVNEGDTVVRPLNSDINWNACTLFDPDGNVVRIVLNNGMTSVLLDDHIECDEHDETNHDARNDRPSFLLVTDDDGAETRLNFIYRTE